MEERPATLEEALALVGRVVQSQATQSEALQALTKLGEMHGRQLGAQQRLIIALAATGVEHATDRLAFTEELRRLALEPHKEADDPADPSRELIEMYLAKIETYAVTLGRGN